MRNTPAPDDRSSRSSESTRSTPDPRSTRSTRSTQGGDSGAESGAETGQGSDGSAPAPRPRTPALVFDDPLDQQSSDDTDRGWGERPSSTGGAADLARFLDEKPPHHL
ncbi:hypothetical protein [Streptomyces sp. ODS05-4]|uniref:hypothetical protein n=1 Tax=Streptomyces sp. ODS05-4 TaxID=2944939 RepID=UPI00210CA90A|nr:hypothetical protein [Streptomyces sp. ODS05-4]